VVPVIEALAPRLPVPISVDTSKPEVMRAAAAAGATLINDVRALRAPGASRPAVETGLPVCLMHMQGEPRTMQASRRYTDVVAEVRGVSSDTDRRLSGRGAWLESGCWSIRALALASLGA
jgi:dihydropteroate synthase